MSEERIFEARAELAARFRFVLRRIRPACQFPRPPKRIGELRKLETLELAVRLSLIQR